MGLDALKHKCNGLVSDYLIYHVVFFRRLWEDLPHRPYPSLNVPRKSGSGEVLGFVNLMLWV